MTNIYKIKNNNFRFKELDLYIDDFIDIFPESMTTVEIHDFSKNNITITPYWSKITTGFSEIAGQENRTPDICCWIDATLLLSPRAYRLIGDVLRPCGEFLPVKIETETYYLFNCLNTEGNSNKSAHKNLIEFCASVICKESLKNAVQEFGLEGIEFEAIKK